jgi:ubiquitin-like 1-activating enzyme E1 A
MSGISEGEVAVYDRQLRLWGVSAQQRLLKAKVLIWGFEGCNIEACKNLVLAGVSVVIRDHREVKPADAAFDYFLRDEDIGRNRAESASRRVQEMNPLCVVASSVAKPEAKESFEGYAAVCATPGVFGYDGARLCEVDAACRAVSAGFFLTASAGQSAMIFTNLHSHVVKERSPPQGSQEATKSVEEKYDFPSLQEFVELGLDDMRAAKVDAAFDPFQRIFAFWMSEKSPLDAAAADRFASTCKSIAAGSLCSVGLETSSDFYRLALLEPLAHVSSILGGLLSQEVIKAITQRDPPLFNTVLFSAATSSALVEVLPPLSASKKRKAAEMAAPVESFDLDSD